MIGPELPPYSVREVNLDLLTGPVLVLELDDDALAGKMATTG